MRRTLAVSAVLAFSALGTPVPAQMSQLMRHNVLNESTNVFGCATGCISASPEQRCNLFKRVWADLKPSQVNSVAQPITACEKDGFPRYATKPQRHIGDVYISANFQDANGNNAACEAWMSAWDAVLEPASASFVTYYGISSTIINFGETGNGFCPNCRLATEADYETTCNTASAFAGDNSGMCFGALGQAGMPAGPLAGGVIAAGAVAADNSPDTPIGNDLDADPELEPRGGLEPVPVPRITSSSMVERAITVAWDAADNEVTVNRPGILACPPASSFPDETSITVSPTAIAGVRLFTHRRAAVASGPTLAALESTTVTGGVLDAFGNAATTGYCSTDGVAITAGTICPGAHIVACGASGVTGGTCAPNGIDFLPTAQSVTLTEAAINNALGADGPLGSGDVGVLNTKVVYMGSTRAYSDAGAFFLNPKLVSLFSAHSRPFSFGDPAPTVHFDESATRVRGKRVTLTWRAVGGPFESFRLLRALNGLDFEEVAVLSGADIAYSFTDEIRGRVAASVWYRLLYRDAAGVEGQALTRVSLRPDRGR